MDKVQRVSEVINGRRPDRPPVSFWYHFSADEVAGAPAVEAHIKHLEKYDLDFLKVMNDNGYPRDIEVIADVGDLARLKVHPPEAEPFARQIEVIKALAERLDGQLLMTTTVFNAWAVLRRLAAPEPAKHGPPTLDTSEDPRDAKLAELIAADRKAVGEALGVIAESLARFAKACIDAGANGIYLSVRDDWVNTRKNGPGTYDEMVAPTDRKILEAAAPATFNLLHVCGKAIDFVRFAGYPNVHVLNWADRAAGPSIAYARDRVKPAICCGVDNLKTLPEGTPEQCAEQARDALRQAKDRPIMIGPGCTYDPAKVPEANLRAVVEAAKAGWLS